MRQPVSDVLLTLGRAKVTRHRLCRSADAPLAVPLRAVTPWLLCRFAEARAARVDVSEAAETSTRLPELALALALTRRREACFSEDVSVSVGKELALAL